VSRIRREEDAVANEGEERSDAGEASATWGSLESAADAAMGSEAGAAEGTTTQDDAADPRQRPDTPEPGDQREEE
jgi:hypothetical protein